MLKKQLKQKKSAAVAAAVAQAKDLKSALAAQNKTIVHHLLEKFEKDGGEATADDHDVDDDADDVGTKLEELPEAKEVEDENVDKGEEEHNAEADVKSDQAEAEPGGNEASQSPDVDDGDDDDHADDDEEMEHEGEPETNRVPPIDELVHNPWSKRVKVNNDFNDDKPFVADDFKAAFEERKRKQREGGLLNGWEECDIADCFCKEEPLGQGEIFIHICFLQKLC